jgi:chorismate synthase
MGSNTFGRAFRVTTWGESHGKAIGAVVDGCPAGLSLSENDIHQEMSVRRGGRSPLTTPRKEPDDVEILSGVYEGKTTGAPISLIIYNRDIDSSKYGPIQHLMRPGHANFTYLEKYGIFDPRGGGRASARETACRVAAGAIAKKILVHHGIHAITYLKELSDVKASISDRISYTNYHTASICPDEQALCLMKEKIEHAKVQNDSLGAVIESQFFHLPKGLGDPIYEKLEALIASAMLSIPACKGVEFGAGFKAAAMRGSEHNDIFCLNDTGSVVTETNHSGGVLGGISNGMPLVFRVSMKPTSSIAIPQPTLSMNKESQILTLPEGSRNDPCVAIRAIAVVEAMASIIIADSLLMNRLSRL